MEIKITVSYHVTCYFQQRIIQHYDFFFSAKMLMLLIIETLTLSAGITPAQHGWIYIHTQATFLLLKFFKLCCFHCKSTELISDPLSFSGQAPTLSCHKELCISLPIRYTHCSDTVSSGFYLLWSWSRKHMACFRDTTESINLLEALAVCPHKHYRGFKELFSR